MSAAGDARGSAQDRRCGPNGPDPQPDSGQAASEAHSAPESPAARLRAAAELLEQRAATTRDYVTNPWAGKIRDTLVPWVALMSPDLAGPLAAWLRVEANVIDTTNRAVETGVVRVVLASTDQALAVAAAILGGVDR